MSCEFTGGPFLKGARPTARILFEDVFTHDPVDPLNIQVITTSPVTNTRTPYATPDATIYQALVPVVGEWFFTFPAGLTEVGKWFVYVDGDGGIQEGWFQISGVHTTV